MTKRNIRCMNSIARKAIKFITMMMLGIALVLATGVDVKAETNSNVAFYLARQPANVRSRLAKQGVTINVMDQLDYSAPELATTWAYTNMYGSLDNINRIEIVLQKGYESALTHEVGHCISNYGNIAYYWAKTPEFTAITAAESHNSVFAAQGWDNPIEYFACAYAMYIDFPAALKQFHPMTYNYIQAVLAQTN